MRFTITAFIIAATATVASAHVEVASGPAHANKSEKITFAIAHGCTGADTKSVTVTSPAGVTSVRALYSDLGAPTVTKDASNNVTSVTWQKTDAEVFDSDYAWYEVTIRAHLPDAAFSKLQFNVTQVCRDANGVETTVLWDQPPGSMTGSPAPIVTIVPPRIPGWNKYTLTAAIAEADVPTYFGDAQIVWKGTAAYSPNALVAAMIAMTSGVTVLTGDLAANDELWVKY
jgi:uncharacterized protein YcnI